MELQENSESVDLSYVTPMPLMEISSYKYCALKEEEDISDIPGISKILNNIQQDPISVDSNDV